MNFNEEEIKRFSEFLKANDLSDTLRVFVNEVNTKSVAASLHVKEEEDIPNKKIKLE